MNKKKESEKEVMNRLAASCSPGFIVPESSLYVISLMDMLNLDIDLHNCSS